MAVGQAPTRDIGTPDLFWGTWGQGLLSEWWETSPELIWPQSVLTYSRMRHDPQLKAVLNAYSLPLLRATWVLDPAGCRDEVVQRCSDNLGIGILGADSAPGPARRRGVIWHRHLRQALQHLAFGYMPFELRYRIEGSQTHLDNLGPRMPWTLAMINLNPDATIRDVMQTTQLQPIPANRLVWYVTGQEGANWAGIPIIRPAYGAWLIKHEIWRVHATSIRRFGMGVPYVEAPAGATAAQVAQARDMAQAMRAGESSGAGVPQGFRPMLMGLTGSVPDPMAFLEYLDTAMAKMVLAALIDLGQTRTASRALGETFMNLFLLSLQGSADEIATTATSGQPGMPGIVTDLVNQNWGEDEPAPRVVCTDVGENYQATAEAISALTTAKALTPDTALEAWIRKTWRLPEIETPLAPPAPAHPGGPGQQGDAGESPPVPGSPPAVPTPAELRGPSGTPPTGVQGSRRTDARASGAPAGGAFRRALTEREVHAGFDPGRLHTDWLSVLDGLVAAYRAVVRAARADLVDKVIAALAAGRIDKLASLDTEAGGGAAVLQSYMVQAARYGAQAVMAEAASQGVHIPGDKVRIDEGRLGRLAQVWAALIGRRLGRAAGTRAAQMITVAAVPPQASAVGDEVAVTLEAQTDGPLRDDLGAAVSAGQQAGRLAVLEAAPASAGQAEYVASEILDKNTCGPCRANDGVVYQTLGEAQAAYPTGGYLRCEGMFRCRGTVFPSWEPPEPQAGGPVRAAAVPADAGLVLEDLAAEDATAGDVEAAALAWAAGWDEHKHPRIGHGEHGGEFAHVPGGGGAPSAPFSPREMSAVEVRLGDTVRYQNGEWLVVQRTRDLTGFVHFRLRPASGDRTKETSLNVPPDRPWTVVNRGGHAPADLGKVAPAVGSFPRPHGRVLRRIQDTLVKQMPNGINNPEQFGGKLQEVPLSKVQLVHTIDHTIAGDQAHRIANGEQVPTPVAVHDLATDRYLVLRNPEEAEAWRLVGAEHPVMMVLTPQVQSAEKPKPTGGLNRKAVDDFLRLRLAGHRGEKPDHAVASQLEQARAEFRKGTDAGDKAAIGHIRQAARNAAGAQRSDPKLADRLNAYADKMDAGRTLHRAPAEPPKPRPLGGYSPADVEKWIGSLLDDVPVGGKVGGSLAARPALASARVQINRGKLDAASAHLRSAARDILGGSGIKTGEQVKLADALTAIADDFTGTRRDKLELRGINKDAGQAVLDIRGHIGDLVGTKESRFRGKINGTGRSQRINGTMGWAGEMTLNRQRVSKAMEDLAAGRPGAADGFRTVVHELIHASGRQDPGDGAWYSWTSGGKEIEEGFTELGARLIAGDVADRMGWAEREAYRYDPKQATSLAAQLARYSKTSGLREGLGFGTYHSYVASAWAWCEDLAHEEGFTGVAAQRRARELAVMIAGAGSKEKPELMADLLIKARGGDPAAPAQYGARESRTLSAREATMQAIQKVWPAQSRKTTKNRAPVAAVLRTLKSAGAKL